MAAYADIIISCGSSLAPVNALIAKELNARNAVIMRPRPAPLGKFTLAVIPRHDSPRPRKNVLVTTGAPNRISEELMLKEAARLAARLGLKEAPRLGVLIGGDNADYAMDAVAIETLVSRLKALSEEVSLEILATTSRRTPKEVEALLKKSLGALAACKLLVIANEDNPPGTVPAILGLSDVVLVSGESVSMVSEAANSGRPVLVFSLKKKNARKTTRHERMIKDMDRAGLVRVIKEEAAAEAVKTALAAKAAHTPKKASDYEKIYNAVGNLI
jgi:mitochondrial fission protein ELM1